MGTYVKKVYDLKCQLCGDGFQSNNKYGKYCKKKHYKECLVCEKEFEIKVPNRPAECCSQKCVGVLSRNAEINSNERLKYKLDCQICGDKFYAKSKNKKYCNKIHIKKCKLCNKDFQVNTTHEKYCKDKHYKPCEICGSKFEIKENHRPGKVCSQKCGAYLTYERHKNKEKPSKEKQLLTRDPERLEQWKNLREFLKENKMNYLEISEYFGTNTSHVGDKIRKEGLKNLVETFYRYTKPEEKIKEILLQFNLKEGVDFKPHNRRIIKPLEIDFYIPKWNMAIEVSPTFTHTTKESYLKPNAIEINYHKNKTELCRKKGVFLITIFEWYSEEEIIESINEHLKKKIKEGKEITIDLSLENPFHYEEKGYKKIKTLPPKLFYHMANKHLPAIEADNVTEEQKEKLEKDGYLPIYNCGYEIWKLT